MVNFSKLLQKYSITQQTTVTEVCRYFRFDCKQLIISCLMHLKDHQQTYFVPLQHRHPPLLGGGGGPFITPLRHNLLHNPLWNPLGLWKLPGTVVTIYVVDKGFRCFEWTVHFSCEQGSLARLKPAHLQMFLNCLR